MGDGNWASLVHLTPRWGWLCPHCEDVGTLRTALAHADASTAEIRAALDGLIYTARLSRNVRVRGAVGEFKGEWVAVPLGDFDALRTALTEAEGGGVNGGRCAAQHQTRLGRWVQCARKPEHSGRCRWGADNRVTPAEPFA